MDIGEYMKKIETIKDMIQWATDVNKERMTAKKKCDMQDIWAHSDPYTLKNLFVEAFTMDRGLILCSIYNTMSYEEVEQLLVYLARVKAEKIVDEEREIYIRELDKKEKSLSEKISIFESSKRSIWKRISSMQDRIKHLLHQNVTLHSVNKRIMDENTELRNKLHIATHKAADLDALKNILSREYKD